MILFKDDFHTEGAYLHTETKNISFIKMHVILKKMGIENNCFFLALKDKSLTNINVRELKDPSMDLVAAIAREIKLNPWYYFREVVSIPASGGDPVPFILHRGNLALIWSFYNDIDTYFVIPRQCGKTMGVQSIMVDLQYFRTRNFDIGMLTKDQSLVLENVDRLKSIRNALPPWLVYKDKVKDRENQQGIYYEFLQNTYHTFVNRHDEMGARKLGRGMTIPVLHWDEFEFFTNIDISYPAALPATIAARESAKANGLPCANIITTTAGMLDTPEGKFASKVIGQTMTFTEKLYDSQNKQHLHEIISKNSINKMLYLVFSYLQLGKSHDWFRENAARGTGTKEDIAREYLNIRLAGTGSDILTQEDREKMKSSCIDPVYTDLKAGYVFKWYQHPDLVLKNKLYRKQLIMGLDTSENIGQDFTTLCIVDPTDLSVVCTAKCNEADLITFAYYIAKFMIENDNILLVPERKSTAVVLIMMIYKELKANGIQPLTRIYNEIFQKRNESPFKSIDIFGSNLEDSTFKKYIGYTTSGSNRDALYRLAFKKALSIGVTRLHDATLVDQLNGLVVKNGRIDHADGCHDDLVISYLLACWFVFFGENLHLYKLDKTSFLSGINNKGEKLDPNLKLAQVELQDRIKEVEDMLQRTKYPALRQSLIRELSHLKSLIDTDVIDIEPVRIDDIGKSEFRQDPGFLRTVMQKLRF